MSGGVAEILVRRKHKLGGLILGGAAVAAAVLLLLPAESPAPASGPKGKAGASAASRAAEGPLAALPAREPLGKLRGELFGFSSPSAPRAAARAAHRAPAP